MTQTGRPIREMTAQLSRMPEWLEYHASLARTYESSVLPFKGKVHNYIKTSPLGVVAHLTPWNHPLLIHLKKLAPALATGNSIVVKPSELAPISVFEFAKLLKEAGLPDGVVNIVNGDGRSTGAALIASPFIAKIDLTGGTTTGKLVAEAAGKKLIPVTAELGGKTPVLVFDDVRDVDETIQGIMFAAFIAAGQTCVTGSRILIHTNIYDEIVPKLVKETTALRVGDPMDVNTKVGSVISAASVARIEEFVTTAGRENGRILCGGERASVRGKGHFFKPTLVECSADSTLANKEVFGPVVALIRCASEEEMIAVANQSDYALGAALWTLDLERAFGVAEQMDAGIIWVNGHHFNDPSSPWGGFKDSGLGVENGRAAYESYLRKRSVVINIGERIAWFKQQDARYG